jgi:16S rRNA (guanine(966)-N(2))-methyltransferase RsmD
MRIIGGKHKGRKIYAPKHLPARPTKDITKESLFNTLASRFFFNEISVLDLFAGTGNISFEFASRGTEDITSVDRHAESVRFIEKTAARLGMPVQVVRSDVKKFLETARRTYDVIFMDPPYDMPPGDLLELIDLIFRRKMLDDEGVLIVEHHKNLRLDSHPAYRKTKTYGQSVLSFFEKK